MNSRQKRRFNSYGMSVAEAKEAESAFLKNKPKAKNVHCSYMDYIVTDDHVKNILKRARGLYIYGKHVGSKPLGKVKAKLAAFDKEVSFYLKGLKEAKAENEGVENDS